MADKRQVAVTELNVEPGKVGREGGRYVGLTMRERGGLAFRLANAPSAFFALNSLAVRTP